MKVVTIRPRSGVEAARLADWIESNFQRPGTCDPGPGNVLSLRVLDGNPLVNAVVKVEEEKPPTDLELRIKSAETRRRILHDMNRDLIDENHRLSLRLSAFLGEES